MSDVDWESLLPDLSGQLAPIGLRNKRMRGGYADVYQTSWKGWNVAVKVIMPVNHLKAMRRKICREATIWLGLRHPNILPLLGFVKDEDFEPFGGFVSPWCKYGNSDQYLEQHGGSLLFESRMRLWADTIKGVVYLHSQKPPLVHGDIKPANVLIDEFGVPKLCDFGLSKILHEDPNTTTGLTTTTAHTGTSRYLAIELVDSNIIITPTLKSDVWALGCVGLKFLFSIEPYSNRPHNLQGQIFEDIRKGIPPAMFSESLDNNSSFTARLIQGCWVAFPELRPDAVNLLLRIVNSFPELYFDATGDVSSTIASQTGGKSPVGDTDDIGCILGSEHYTSNPTVSYNAIQTFPTGPGDPYPQQSRFYRPPLDYVRLPDMNTLEQRNMSTLIAQPHLSDIEGHEFGRKWVGILEQLGLNMVPSNSEPATILTQHRPSQSGLQQQKQMLHNKEYGIDNLDLDDSLLYENEEKEVLKAQRQRQELSRFWHGL
ncbi:kinase-like protein [Serendipita vermifera]|nr:kinase-like protein [Serendipita vermifera]